MTFLIGSFIAGVLIQVMLGRLHVGNSVSSSLYSRWSSARSSVRSSEVIFLLMHIGLVGGAEIAGEGIFRFAVPGALGICLALAMFAVGCLMLNALKISDHDTRISLATHFGSVSVGTFATAQAFLTGQGIPFDPSSAAWLALMEVPSILVGALCLGGGLMSLKQTLRDRDVLILLGSLVAGFILGPKVIHGIDFLVVDPFEFVLVYFLFDMGQRAGYEIAELYSGGIKLVIFGLAMPIAGASLGCIASRLAGMSLGNMVLLSTLSASASYVAATAVMGKMVSPRAIATSLAVSLGITLPWNIIFGIPIYTKMALALERMDRLAIGIPSPSSYIPTAPALVGATLIVGLAVCLARLVWMQVRLLYRMNRPDSFIWCPKYLRRVSRSVAQFSLALLPHLIKLLHSSVPRIQTWIPFLHWRGENLSSLPVAVRVSVSWRRIFAFAYLSILLQFLVEIRQQ